MIKNNGFPHQKGLGLTKKYLFGGWCGGRAQIYKHPGQFSTANEGVTELNGPHHAVYAIIDDQAEPVFSRYC